MESRQQLRKDSENIRIICQKIVADEYEKKGHSNKHIHVGVFEEKFSVQLNSENPFLGKDFFILVDDVIDKISESVKDFGFIYQNVEFFYDFCYINFIKSSSNAES